MKYILLFVCRVCPIFQVSNVTGDNLPLLKMFLNLLSSGGSYSESEPAKFQIDETYSVPVSLSIGSPKIDVESRKLLIENKLAPFLFYLMHAALSLISNHINIAI